MAKPKQKQPAKKQPITEIGDFASRYPDECWVKIPDAPTVDAMRVCLKSLIVQLQAHDVQRLVKGIKILDQDNTILIELE